MPGKELRFENGEIVEVPPEEQHQDDVDADEDGGE